MDSMTARVGGIKVLQLLQGNKAFKNMKNRIQKNKARYWTFNSNNYKIGKILLKEDPETNLTLRAVIRASILKGHMQLLNRQLEHEW